MGNCGSSLNCDRCFDYEPRRNCSSKIEANADIAGYGILIAFYISASLLSIVVVWGWFRRFLPSDLLTSTDRYTVQLLKRRRTPFTISDVQTAQTAAQKKTSYLVTHFTKIFGDQQLVSGTAILSAGLASRCDTSLLEFNIVTCLAYLCTFTHLLSLTISREYLYKHKVVRGWRVALTICFFLLFCFSYTVNTVGYDEDFGTRSQLNMGNVFQCVFEATRFNKSVKFSAWYSVTLLGVLFYSHALAISDLFIAPDTDSVTEIVNSFMRRSLEKTSLSEEERREVVYNSFNKYYAWLRPPKEANAGTKISAWYVVQVYFDAYMSQIPGIFAGMGFGTVSTARAIWDTGFDISGLDVFGFGQVVALGLLALTVLAVVEIINEQAELASETKELKDFSTPNRSTRVSSGLGLPADAHILGKKKWYREWLIQIGVPKTKHELHILAAARTAPDDYEDSTIIARRLAKVSSAIWIFHACLYTYAGLAWDFEKLEASVVTLLVLWTIFRIFLAAKRILNQMYFVKMEASIRIRNKILPASSSQQPLVQATPTPSAITVASTQPSTIQSPPASGPTPPPPNPSNREGSFNPLPRTDAGHDSGIISPVEGVTYRGSFPFGQAS